jgi:hypothetical protein
VSANGDLSQELSGAATLVSAMGTMGTNIDELGRKDEHYGDQAPALRRQSREAPRT